MLRSIYYKKKYVKFSNFTLVFVLCNKNATLKLYDLVNKSNTIKFLKDCLIEAWDVSKEAISVAKQNCKKQKTKISLKLIDIRNNIYLDEKFDIIVSNPIPPILGK